MSLRKLNFISKLSIVAVAAMTMLPIGGDFGIARFGATQAQAGSVSHGEVRRTARRVDRRDDRRDDRHDDYIVVLPSECVVVDVNGHNYWLCGNIYYDARDDNGTTVYVVVNL